MYVDNNWPTYAESCLVYWYSYLTLLTSFIIRSHPQFPHSSDRWSFASRVHPSVRHALYYANTTTQQAVICSHYRLPRDTYQTVDFGDITDIYGLYSATTRSYFHTGSNPRISKQLLADAIDDEDERDQIEASELKRSRRSEGESQLLPHHQDQQRWDKLKSIGG